MRIMKISLFLGGASFLAHQVAGEHLGPSNELEGCIFSNETASGLACPGPPGIDNSIIRRKASVTGGLIQISNPALMADAFIWSALGPPFTGVPSPTPPVVSVLNLNTVKASVATGAFERRDQGTGWAGTFPSPMPLIWNMNNGPVTLQFSQPLSAFVTYVMVRD